jgi:hypothetical protein
MSNDYRDESENNEDNVSNNSQRTRVRMKQTVFNRSNKMDRKAKRNDKIYQVEVKK